MTEDSVRVVFEGKLKEGMPTTDVKRRLAEQFHLNEGQVAVLFGGGPVVVKKGVDRTTAEKYVAAFDQAGAICRIEPEFTLELSSEDLKPIAEERFRAESRVKAEQEMGKRVDAHQQAGEGEGTVPPGQAERNASGEPMPAMPKPMAPQAGLNGATKTSETGPCPVCGEAILALASKCHHCGSLVNGSSGGANQDEEMLADVGANLLRGIEPVGGRLMITSRRLLFEPHAINFHKMPAEFLFCEIKEVSKCNWMGLIPNGMLIRTKTGMTYKFVVFAREKLISILQARIRNA